MYRTFLKAKIHRATVTEANLNYVGSITIAEDLMEAVHMDEYEKVQVVNINNAARIETYIIKGERNSGIICLNGAAARFFEPQDKVIIMSYCQLSESEKVNPEVIFLDDDNKIYQP